MKQALLVFVLIGLLFNAEDAGNMFLWNVFGRQPDLQRKGHPLHSHHSENQVLQKNNPQAGLEMNRT